jgi:hypothetical protein
MNGSLLLPVIRFAPHGKLDSKLSKVLQLARSRARAPKRVGLGQRIRNHVTDREITRDPGVNRDGPDKWLTL